MRLSAQEEYGLRCLLQVAREPEGALTTPQLAEREGLGAAHVHKLMRLLRRGGLGNSVRGRNGGYQLARPAEQISVASVLAVLGGNLYSRDFCGQHKGVEPVCVRNRQSAIRPSTRRTSSTTARRSRKGLARRASTRSIPSCATPSTSWEFPSSSSRGWPASRWTPSSTASRSPPPSRRSWQRPGSSSARSPRRYRSTPSSSRSTSGRWSLIRTTSSPP